MKKIFFVTLIIVSTIFIISFNQKSIAIPNPWIDCGDDISCGAKKAGFNLPIAVRNYSVRAMAGILEINFPLDKKRYVSVRKSKTYEGNLSGVYENYPVNKTISINGVMFNVKGKKNKFYVTDFAAESGYYSFYSKQGLKINDIKHLYSLLAEAEAPRQVFNEKSNYTTAQLRSSRLIDGIVEPVYTQDCFPRTLQKKGVTKNCFVRANLGEDSVCSASEIKMIKEYYKKGYKKDPLNNGEGQFCAK